MPDLCGAAGLPATLDLGSALGANLFSCGHLSEGIDDVEGAVCVAGAVIVDGFRYGFGDLFGAAWGDGVALTGGGLLAAGHGEFGASVRVEPHTDVADTVAFPDGGEASAFQTVPSFDDGSCASLGTLLQVLASATTGVDVKVASHLPGLPPLRPALVAESRRAQG